MPVSARQVLTDPSLLELPALAPPTPKREKMRPIQLCPPPAAATWVGAIEGAPLAASRAAWTWCVFTRLVLRPSPA